MPVSEQMNGRKPAARAPSRFATLTRWHNSTGLLRQFAILSLIVIGLISIALSLVISYYLRKDLLEREWRLTADYTRTEALYHLTPTDFAAPTTRQARENFKKLYDQTVMMPEIVRVKIYDATKTVVWSDEPRLIGRRFPGNPDLVSALAGRTMVRLGTEQKGENIYEENDAGHLVEVYVPIVFPGTTRVAGVVETYKLPEQVFANIRRGRLIVAGTALAGGVLLYLSLFWIVRGAARRIESQRALTAHVQAAREEERSSIAHEAREELAQVLTALKIDLAWVAATLPEDQPAVRATTKGMLALLNTAMESALQIASGARPGVLDTLGLAAALDWEARRFQGRTGIQCQFTSSSEHLDLDREQTTAVFRILQEALGNIVRHAEATRVRISLEEEEDRLCMIVEDNGRGITQQEIAGEKHFGLELMRERAAHLGGGVTIVGRPGGGTTMTMWIGLPQERHRDPDRR